MVAATASHKTAQLRNPSHGLAQRGRLCRWRRTVMDGTIQRLPFLEVQQHATGHLGHRPRQHGGVKNPPGNDAIERQDSAASARRLANWRASMRQPLFKIRCQTSMPQRHEYHCTRSMASSTVSTATVVNSSHSIGSPSAGGLDFMDLHGPQRHRRQAFRLAVARRTQASKDKSAAPAWLHARAACHDVARARRAAPTTGWASTVAQT